MLELLASSPAALYAAAAVLGLIIGSFLNVVILRMPAQLERRWRLEAQAALGVSDDPEAGEPAPSSLVSKRSCCPQCGTQIRAYDNVPVLSYLWLRGRCRACRGRISIQYPLVELLTAVAFVLCAWRFGVQPQALAGMALAAVLIAASGIDFRTQLLPDALTLPLLWLGLLLSLWPLFASPQAAILGAAIGYLSLWSVYWAFKLLTGKEGMGYGDFKLLGALGAWMGATSILPIVLLSSVVGAVMGGLAMLIQKRDSQLPMPFGPFLAAAGFIYFLFAPQLQSWIPLFAM